MEETKLNKAASMENPMDTRGLNPEPEKLNPEQTINFNILKKLAGLSLVSAKQLDKEIILEISKFAALLQGSEIASSHPLDGKIIITAFFEASTRTRLSFESAVLRLDGKIVSIPDAKQTGVAKGESLEDIGEMFNAYGDLVIMRHTETQAVEQIIDTLRIPLINAGNGSGEHPTQALADWFALLKWRPILRNDHLSEEQKIHLGIIGTPGSMRSVKSFLLMSLFFKNSIKKITIISEIAEPLDEDLTHNLEETGIDYEIQSDIQEVLEDLDVIYMNSIAYLGDSYKSLDQRFKLKKDSGLKPDTVIMHPLARLDELSPSLDNTEHNLYFSQAHGAVYMRQALLIAMLNRFDFLPARILIK